MKRHIQYNQSSDSLNWTGYLYGTFAHSSHIEYGEQSEVIGEASVRRGLKRMGLKHEDVVGLRVMDVGTGCCGLGFRRLGAIVEHHDISTRTVDALNSYAKDRGYTKLKSFRTNLISDELPTEHFDLINLCSIYHHLEEPTRALVNLSQSLKIGGYLYIDIYRSGRWRWFVVDVLRKILDKSLLHDVLSALTGFCALGEKRSFHLRQVELLVVDLFGEKLHLFHPEDLKADVEALGLELVRPVTSMELIDPGERVDHSLLFAHVYSTLVFRKTGPTDTSKIPTRTIMGRCQIAELEGMPGTYSDLASLTSQFILAHEAGEFTREKVISFIVNLYRMAHPCLPGDLYLVPGIREPAGSLSVAGDEQTRALRHSLWCTFLANAINVRNPLEKFHLESLGYELVRFPPESH